MLADLMLILARILLFAAVLAPVALAIWKYVKCAPVQAITNRNVAGYFSGVLGYLFIVVFVVACAIFAYVPEFFTTNDSNLDYLTQWFPVLLLFIVPAITMSIWADEKKVGTEELLFTLPATDLEVLLAKYLAVVAVYTVALVFSAPVVFALELIGQPDWGIVVANYFGYWLAGISLLAAGMFASSLTRSVTVAFVLGVVICAIPVGIEYIVPVAAFLFGDAGFLSVIAEGFSLSEQLRDFGLGMVPLAGLLYFASLTMFMLYLNLVVISERHWSRSRQTDMGLQYAIRTAALAVALVSLNAIATHASARADLTTNNVYTLSGTTAELIGKIKSERPVTIQAFFSEEVPRDYAAVKRRLIGLLRQYDQIGGGRIEVRQVEVGAFSEEASEAEQYGIEPTQVADFTAGQREDYNVYLGVVITSSFDEVVLPFIGPGTPIEYELTRSIRTVSNEERLTIGILDTDANVRSGSQGFSRIIDELKKQYDIEHVSPEGPIEEGQFSVLLAVMPSSLTQPQMQNLVDYVSRGNAVLIFDDPFPYVYNTGFGVTQAPRLPKPSPGGGGMFGMNRQPSTPKADDGRATTLLDALGIEWDNGEIVYDAFNPHKEFMKVVPKEFLFISNESGNPRAVNPDSKITGPTGDAPGLQEIMAVFAGHIPEPEKGADVNFEKLLVTSADSSTLEWDEFSEDGFSFFGGSPTPTRQLKPEYERVNLELVPVDIGGREVMEQRVVLSDKFAYVVAARITSKKDSSRKVNAVFVADADMISDWFFYQRDRADVNIDLDNVEFVLNAVDVLAGDESYLALRKRSAKSRPLDRFERMTEAYRDELARAQERIEQEAADKIKELEKRYEERREKIREDENLDPRARAQMLQNIDETEAVQAVIEKQKIERQKRRESDQQYSQFERQRRRTQNTFRFATIVLAPVPAVIAGIAILLARQSRERREITPTRHA